MDQYRGPHSRAHVRRTRREKAKLVMKRERHPCSEISIQPIDRSERLVKREPRSQRLQAQMVLFIHHDAQAVGEKHRGSRPQSMLSIQTRQLLAHEVPLVEERAVR